jgi:trk system potassium uptake protein TrkA
MKQFAIIGLGNFGSTVARELAKAGFQVTAIDSEKSRVQLLQDYLHPVILANATDRKFLENLEVKNFDCIIVSTGADSHASILTTLLLKELGAQRIVVKANSADHAKILLKVGASEAIIPEQQMAVKLSRSLAQPNLVDYLPLAPDFYVAEIVPPAAFVGRKLMELQLRTKFKVQVIAVKDRQTDQFDFVPGGDYTVRASDLLVVLGQEVDINKIKE